MESTLDKLATLASVASTLASIHPYSDLFFAVLQAIIHRRDIDALDWDTVKGQIGGLASEATIATFLAAVQSQIIALSYQDNSTGVKVATNTLGFAGVLLDVITAFLAVLSSTILQRHISIVENQLDTIGDASLQRLTKILYMLDSTSTRSVIGDAVGHRRGDRITPDIARLLLIKITKRFRQLLQAQKDADTSQARAPEDDLTRGPTHSEAPHIDSMSTSFTRIRSATVTGDAPEPRGGDAITLDTVRLLLLQTTKQLLRTQKDSEMPDIGLISTSFIRIRSATVIGNAAGTAMLFGILCFFASVQCLAISTQPTAVWIVSAAMCLCIIILPVVNGILALVRIRLPSVFDI
ncbi:hypothetical protein MVEN_00616700 [Mycena venus]|uniref:Transmembrane protein n=1 Tax=Mycena venus TaxID=2733690 RepID=A0A8H6YQG7_9AGAR|nr:hypothetical protein MVEN_00616700 [Mycena venus]